MTDKPAKNATPPNAPGNPRATKNQSRAPNYARVSFVAFLCGVAVLILLIVNAEKLSRFGLSQQVYYLILVLIGLTAAGFLFGVLQSTATYVGKFWGGTLRLSGSVVGVALVVIGGYYFIPKATFFPLTVYVHGEGGPQDIVLRGTGRVFLKLGPEISSELIGENGQAVFPRIPADYRGQQVPGWVESDDYEAINPTVTIAGSNVDLIVKKKINHFKLAGTVLDDHGNPLPGVRVALPAYRMEDTTNNEGRFEFQVTAEREQMVDLTAEKQGYQTIRLSPTLGDVGVNFSLKGAGNAVR
jgi:Carboxypeptidase regulatory-like domain